MKDWDAKAVEAAQNRQKGGRERTKQVGPPNPAPDPPASLVGPENAKPEIPVSFSPWTYQEARGVTGHRIVCQAPSGVDKQHFLDYLNQYREP